MAGVDGLLDSVSGLLYILPCAADGLGVLRLRQLLPQGLVLLPQLISFRFHFL